MIEFRENIIAKKNLYSIVEYFKVNYLSRITFHSKFSRFSKNQFYESNINAKSNRENERFVIIYAFLVRRIAGWENYVIEKYEIFHPSNPSLISKIPNASFARAIYFSTNIIIPRSQYFKSKFILKISWSKCIFYLKNWLVF